MVTELRFVQENFLHVVPILVAGGAGLAIGIERFRALVVIYPLRGAPAFFETLRSHVLADQLPEAILLCERHRKQPVANVVREGLLRAHQPEQLIEHGLEIAVGEAADRVRARTSFLATIANVSTLLGLLGTILGLVRSFEAVGGAGIQSRSALLAQGISTAMNSTLLGLAVAIPAMIAYSFLINRSNRLQSELGRAAVRTVDLLKQRYFAGAPETQKSAPAPEAMTQAPKEPVVGRSRKSSSAG